MTDIDTAKLRELLARATPSEAVNDLTARAREVLAAAFTAAGYPPSYARVAGAGGSVPEITAMLTLAAEARAAAIEEAARVADSFAEMRLAEEQSLRRKGLKISAKFAKSEGEEALRIAKATRALAESREAGA